MAKATKTTLTPQQQVTAHIERLDPANAEIITAIRKMVLSVSKEIEEQIKWNSPAFCYTGDMLPFDPKEYKRDIMVVNLHRGNILLVLPSGAKVADTTGIYDTTHKDGRGIVKIADMADLRKKEKPLKQLVKDWLAMVEK